MQIFQINIIVHRNTRENSLDCLIAPSGIDAFDIPSLKERDKNKKCAKSKLAKKIRNVSSSTLTAIAGYPPLLVVPMTNHQTSKMPLGVSFMSTAGADHLLLQIACVWI